MTSPKDKNSTTTVAFELFKFAFENYRDLKNLETFLRSCPYHLEQAKMTFSQKVKARLQGLNKLEAPFSETDLILSEYEGKSARLDLGFHETEGLVSFSFLLTPNGNEKANSAELEFFVNDTLNPYIYENTGLEEWEDTVLPNNAVSSFLYDDERSLLYLIKVYPEGEFAWGLGIFELQYA